MHLDWPIEQSQLLCEVSFSHLLYSYSVKCFMKHIVSRLMRGEKIVHLVNIAYSLHDVCCFTSVPTHM